MPQISVNEIDQSVVTRVVSDDKVKILVPVIASFGPGYDGTLTSVNTFTDVTDFNRTYGYTDAEFNPFTNDYSRIYATQLIEKGGAVSVVRVNNSGLTADFDIEGAIAGRSTPSVTTVSKAVAKSINPVKTANIQLSSTQTTTLTIPSDWTDYQIIPGTVKITSKSGSVYTDKIVVGTPTQGQIVNSSGNQVGSGTITYGTGVISAITSYTDLTDDPVTVEYNYISTSSNFAKYTFCPQIDSITAKYPGSFGNNLAISIAQVNTTRVAESYQYANISVYYVKRVPVYATDMNNGVINNSYITNVTLLESKRVSTNPNDAYYFEDVDFDFIKINATSTARDELSLIWSNINATASSTAVLYAGFPVINLKYVDMNGISTYNTDSVLNNGTDFGYSDSTLTKLQLGFMGYYSNGNWTKDDVNTYMDEVYGDGGIVPQIYNSVAGLYADFTDPYVYDFDFITSGGFVYEEYELAFATTKYSESKEYATSVTLTAPNAYTTVKIPYNSSVSLTVTVGTGNDAVTTTYKTNAPGNSPTLKDATAGSATSIVFVGYPDNAATINYNTGVITLPTASNVVINNITYTYNDASLPYVAYPTLPITTDKGVVYTDVNPIHTAMLNLVNTRQDCVALFDVPANYDPMQIVEYSRMLNTSYGTIHNPWCWVQSPTVAGKNILMAPSYIFLYTFLSNLINNVESQKWFPPAGVKRATARVVKKPYYEIGSVILNAWQNDNTSRVNPIMKLKNYGYVIYGQYTTLPAIDMYTHSALESLNVRLISNVVKKKIFDTCLNMAFEPNTSTLWLQFYSKMDEFLRYMQYNEGVYDYKIVMDESTVTTDDINNLRCPGKVYIAPTRTAEFFDIDFIITDAGAIFTED